MLCRQCKYVMEMVVLEKAGPVWICDRCGLTVNDGTVSLVLPVFTSGN